MKPLKKKKNKKKLVIGANKQWDNNPPDLEGVREEAIGG